MARDQEVSVIIRAKDLTGRAFAKFRKGMRSISRGVRDATRMLVRFTAVTTAAVVGLTKLAQRGSAVIAVKKTFARITGDEVKALKMLREATRGTVSDMKLMTLHNQAVALGAVKTTEEFAKMAEMTRILGRAQGIDAATALNKFTIGLARQSRLRLDDLGIILLQTEANERYAATIGKHADKLTESERKIAFRNDALRIGFELVEKLSAGENTATESADRLATAMANLGDKLATVAAESEVLGTFFDQVEGIVGDLIDILSADADSLADGMAALGALLGQAFAGAFLFSVGAVLESIDRILLPKFAGIEEKIMTVFGAAGGALKGSAADSFAALPALREALGSAGRAGKSRAESIASGARDETRRRELETEIGDLVSTGARMAVSHDPVDLEMLKQATERLTAARNELAEIEERLAQRARLELQTRVAAAPMTLERRLDEALEGLTGPDSLILVAQEQFGGFNPQLGTMGPGGGGVNARRNRAIGQARQFIGDQLTDFGARSEAVLDPGGVGERTQAFLKRQSEERQAAAKATSQAATEAAKDTEQMSAVAISSITGAVAAIAAGSENIGASLIGMIARVGQSLAGGGILGSIIGGFGGIIAGFASKRNKEPVPVQVADYTDNALSKLSNNGEPIHITTIIEQGGVEIERIERELFDRQNRDEVVRFGRSFDGRR